MKAAAFFRITVTDMRFESVTSRMQVRCVKLVRILHSCSDNLTFVFLMTYTIQVQNLHNKLLLRFICTLLYPCYSEYFIDYYRAI